MKKSCAVVLGLLVLISFIFVDQWVLVENNQGGSSSVKMDVAEADESRMDHQKLLSIFKEEAIRIRDSAENKKKAIEADDFIRDIIIIEIEMRECQQLAKKAYCDEKISASMGDMARRYMILRGKILPEKNKKDRREKRERTIDQAIPTKVACFFYLKIMLK